jgi:predicted nucleic acid-binding protein
LRASAYTARGICADLLRHVLAEHDLVTGEVSRVELRRVLRDRFGASPPLALAIEEELRDQIVVPLPPAPAAWPASDPDDRWVLASAIAGRADLLVTGDRDLLEGAAESPVAIVDPRGCWERLRG